MLRRGEPVQQAAGLGDPLGARDGVGRAAEHRRVVDLDGGPVDLGQGGGVVRVVVEGLLFFVNEKRKGGGRVRVWWGGWDVL